MRAKYEHDCHGTSLVGAAGAIIAGCGPATQGVADGSESGTADETATTGETDGETESGEESGPGSACGDGVLQAGEACDG